MADEIVVKVNSKELYSRSFSIHIDNKVFDVILDERRFIYVQGKKIGYAHRLVTIPLGTKSGEIEVYFYPFSFGLKIINLRVEKEIVYSEKIKNPQASKAELYVNKATELFLYSLFGGFPLIVIVGGILNLVGTFMVKWLNLTQINKTSIESVSFGLGAIISIALINQATTGIIHKSLFVEKKTITEIESLHMYHGVPFGYINHDWEDFKSHYKEGDEIWLWRTSPRTWEMLVGREGYVIVRNGKVTKHSILVGMN